MSLSNEQPLTRNGGTKQRWLSVLCLALAVPAGAATLTQVTDNPASDWDPSWSPDGTVLVFTSDRMGGHDLWLTLAEGGTPLQLVDGPYCYHPVWSPDGKRIAFSAEFAGNGDIWTVRPDGGGLKQLTTDPGRDLYLGWSRKRIIFESDRTGDWEIWSISRQGGAPTRLTESGGLDYGPSGSRDGSRIAFSSQRAGTYDLWLMPAEGGEATQLTSLPDSEWAAAWSPGDGTIAFDSDRGGNWDIWMIQTSGGRPWRVTTDPADDIFPAWSPDGTKMAFSSDRAGNEDIWILDLIGVSGCVELGGEPLSGAEPLLKQGGRPKRRLESGADGCFIFPALREQKKFKLQLDGPEVTVEGAELTACFNLNDDPLVRAKVSLKQPGSGARSQRTGEDGCVLFENLEAERSFKLTLKGPRVGSQPAGI
ncbi:MAG: hypothetical protein GY769_23990 [bacterium]|nr:hypothetical protein [bacterium]